MSDERIVGIVDVPGHVDFIRNMVAGAHGINVVILVVAADDGVMPQTREHLDILTLMGARHGLVAMTKIDLVDEGMRRCATEDVQQFLKGTFLEDASICGISNTTGEGFEGFFAALNDVVEKCQPRESWRPFRMWIERSFSIRGFGTVVSGIPTSGRVAVGDEVRLIPSDRKLRVRGLEVYGQKADVGNCGECVALNLADADQDSLQRGAVLCEEGAFEEVAMVEAELCLLGHMPRELRDYAEVHLHVGTAQTMARVALLEGEELPPGGRGMVQLRLARPLCIAPGERFVIRSAVGGPAGGRLTTVGGGRILATSNIRLRRNRPWTLASLEARCNSIDSPAAWCELTLRQARGALNIAQLAKSAHMPAEKVAQIVNVLRKDGSILETPNGAFVHSDVVRELAGRVADQLEAFHGSDPLRLGVDQPDLHEQIEADRTVFNLAVERLLADKTVTRHGGVIALAGRRSQISGEDMKLCEQIESALLQAHLAPPRPDELAELLRETQGRVDEMIALLVDRGTLVRLDRKVVMHRRAVKAARQLVLRLFSQESGFSTVQFRDALGVSRKYAVGLLDYFDTIRFTVRSGSRRTPGAEARRLLEADE